MNSALMFLGLWEVIPVKVPKHLGLTTINFSRVFINEASMTFSGGDQGKIDDDVQTIRNRKLLLHFYS